MFHSLALVEERTHVGKDRLLEKVMEARSQPGSLKTKSVLL